ncbi:nucleophosmin-like [Sciurus carolinensis]|uniref:nucleophosmin-like n=1 Tax=Sciurus carolinensis TaxID=30640 RepID=UPI001FB41748|nr:nucleophosmin-like [Sciurus carolinensis]
MESEDEKEENVNLLSVSGKIPAPGNGSKILQKKINRDADEGYDDAEEDDDDDFDDEETEEKASVKKGQESFKKQKKTPKRPKGPSSVEGIKTKMQVNREKGDSLPMVEANFMNYVKNCFQMTDQEDFQDLGQ